jgi:hypothetical protein
MHVHRYTKLHWYRGNLGFEQFPINTCRGFIPFVANKKFDIVGGDCIVRAHFRRESLLQNYMVTIVHLTV